MGACCEVEVCPARVDCLEFFRQGTRIIRIPARSLEVGRKSRGDDGARICGPEAVIVSNGATEAL